MKKVLRKIKEKLIIIGSVILSFPTKVFAITAPKTPLLYGIPNPEPEPPVSSIWSSILNICKFFIIPIALIVGIIMYIKKSKSSKKRKFITILIILAIVILMYIGINYLVKEVL